MVAVLVVAKAPVAGLVKTRLTPPLSPVDGARLAAAALLDTLDAVAATPGAYPVLALAGDLSRCERRSEITSRLAGFEVVEQRGTTFGRRLANAHADAARTGLPVLQIGMDTPQVHPDLLGAAAVTLLGADAVLGPAADGGWWALGLHDPRAAEVLAGVPMSHPDTGARTWSALERIGLRPAPLPTLIDVDEYSDIAAVAADPNCGSAFRAEAAVRC